MDASHATKNHALDLVVRKRQYYPKSRTGCPTCRIRRVKCDETRPSCLKCTSTGRVCDGYETRQSPLPKPMEYEPLARPLGLAPCSTALESKAFDHFKVRSVPVLSGHFQDQTYSRTALQLYQTEPAVRHIINAFGALHLEVHARSLASGAGVDASLQTRLPIEQYTRALQETQVLLSKRDVPLEIVLTCAMLMVQFEGLSHDFVPAMLHAQKAINLLPLRAKKIDDSLTRTMLRFYTQIAMHTGHYSPQLAAYTAHLDTVMPVALTSSAQARDMLVTWSSRLYAFIQSVASQYIMEPGGVALEEIAQARKLEEVFSQLSDLLRTFARQSGATLPIREQHGLQVLQARATILRITAATCLYSEATVYDAYVNDFEYVLDVCATLMSDPKADSRFFVLHMDEGLVHPLYVVATHCRDSRIRHKAFDLLRELPAGNGTRIWHADVVILTAKLIIEYEEAGQQDLRCADVPEWRRVHHASFDNWDIQSWHQTFGGPLRIRPNGSDGEWMDLHLLAGPSVAMYGAPLRERWSIVHPQGHKRQNELPVITCRSNIFH